MLADATPAGSAIASIERASCDSSARDSRQPAGTRRIFTEQAALSDGYNDLAGREEGTRAGLDNLDAELKREPGRA